MKRYAVPLILAACAGLLAGCNAVKSVIAQSAGTPGSVTLSWAPPTQNTDGSAIAGTLTFTAYEMAPCSSDAECAGDTKVIGTSATGVPGSSAQVSGLPDGTHCFAVQAVELLPDGATTSSALSAVTPAACVLVTGSNVPQPSPNAPTGVKTSPGG